MGFRGSIRCGNYGSCGSSAIKSSCEFDEGLQGDRNVQGVQ